MYLTHLSLTNFRNYARLDLEISPGLVLLVGDNAQGKTSLLEAIFYLATFMSFHASNDQQLIHLLAEREPVAVARVVATFCRTIEHEPKLDHKTIRLEVRLILEANNINGTPRLRKEVLLDGTKQKVGDVVGAFNAVLFLPQMLRILEGSPEDRRRYLNLAMAQILPHFANTLTEYHQVVSQRNALLKQLGQRGVDIRNAGGQLAFWDEKLARKGAEIMYLRIQAIKELEHLATRVHHELSHGQEVLRLAYLPSFEPLQQPSNQFILPLKTSVNRTGLSQEKIYERFVEALEKSRAEELARGVTTIGPHRDDFRFLANELDLGIYGSRGQVRSAVMSLKLAEVSWMKERSGEWPVLLLDEVLAELDHLRRTDLLKRLLESEQALMTTTDLDLFSNDFVRSAQVWQVKAGYIRKDPGHDS